MSQGPQPVPFFQLRVQRFRQQLRQDEGVGVQVHRVHQLGSSEGSSGKA